MSCGDRNTVTEITTTSLAVPRNTDPSVEVNGDEVVERALLNLEHCIVDGPSSDFPYRRVGKAEVLLPDFDGCERSGHSATGIVDLDFELVSISQIDVNPCMHVWQIAPFD